MLVILDIMGEEDELQNQPNKKSKNETENKYFKSQHNKQTRLQIIRIDGTIEEVY